MPGIPRRAVVLALLIACGFATQAQSTAGTEVIVFAASSLTEVMTQLGASYEKKSGAHVTLSFAASSVLARQIENGAPAHIFVSADEDWMNYLADRQLIDAGSRADIARAQLVLIAPADSQVQLKIAPEFRLREALAGGRLALADPASVPAGKYAKSALENLGVWQEVAGSLVQAENVRSALMFVARGEAPFGVVYDTDARDDRRVRVVDAFPESSHPPIRYPIALTRNATSAARGFLNYVRGPDGQAVFRKFGFTAPP
jgi:molybdate transport system substrate-binding protein